MFKNQIPDFPNFGRQGIPAAKPDLTNPAPDIYPVAGNAPQGWGLTFMLSNGGHTGRSRRTGHCKNISSFVDHKIYYKDFVLISAQGPDWQIAGGGVIPRMVSLV